MNTSYRTNNPGHDGNGILGLISTASSDRDSELLWLILAGSIPRVLSDCDGQIELSELELALFGNQLKHTFNPEEVPLLLAYSCAMANAMTTLRQQGVIEYTKTTQLLFLRLSGEHE